MSLIAMGRKALVTGGSQGIGYASAKTLFDQGAEVALVARNKENLVEAADTINALPVCADLATAEGAKYCIESLQVAEFSPDILLLNIGGPPPGSFAETTPDGWRNAADSLFHFPIEFLHAFVEPMKKREWGRIIVITSMAAVEPHPNLIYSNALRAGVHGLVNALSREIACHGVTINAVMPGFIATDRLKKLDIDTRAVCDSIPAKRLGRPEELAHLVGFLASDQASYITGQAIAVDGGFLKSI